MGLPSLAKLAKMEDLIFSLKIKDRRQKKTPKNLIHLVALQVGSSKLFNGLNQDNELLKVTEQISTSIEY